MAGGPKTTKVVTESGRNTLAWPVLRAPVVCSSTGGATHSGEARAERRGERSQEADHRSPGAQPGQRKTGAAARRAAAGCGSAAHVGAVAARPVLRLERADDLLVHVRHERRQVVEAREPHPRVVVQELPHEAVPLEHLVVARHVALHLGAVAQVHGLRVCALGKGGRGGPRTRGRAWAWRDHRTTMRQRQAPPARSAAEASEGPPPAAARLPGVRPAPREVLRAALAEQRHLPRVVPHPPLEVRHEALHVPLVLLQGRPLVVEACEN